MYGILGASFRHYKYKNKNKNIILIYVISSLLIFWLTHLTKENKLFPFYNYTTTLVLLSSFSIFAYFKTLENNIKERKLITTISNNSLGIYGIHAFIIYGISYFSSFYKYNPIITIPVIFLITLILSLIFSLFMKKFDKKGYVV